MDSHVSLCPLTFRQEIASMDISLHETAIAQETVYEVGLAHSGLSHMWVTFKTH